MDNEEIMTRIVQGIFYLMIAFLGFVLGVLI